MKKPKLTTSNIFFILLIVLLIIPQTRKPIQVFIHKGLALISPSEIQADKRKTLKSYNNWVLVDSDGKQFDFKAAKNKVVFINFWATWCPPCIAEMPNIENLYKDYKDQVVFLLVSNETTQVVKQFTEEYDYSFKFYKSVTKPPQQFKTNSIPKTYILDKHGAIVMDKTGAANWNSSSVRNLLDTLIISE